MRIVDTETYALDTITHVVLKNDDERIMYGMTYNYANDTFQLTDHVRVDDGTCRVNTALRV